MQAGASDTFCSALGCFTITAIVGTSVRLVGPAWMSWASSMFSVLISLLDERIDSEAVLKASIAGQPHGRAQRDQKVVSSHRD